MATRAVAVLRRLGIAFELLEFEAETFTAAEAAERLRLRPDQVFKTLVVRADDGRVLLACVPGDGELDLRALARAASARRAEMVEAGELMRLVGYVKGAVSPIGTRRPYPVFLDDAARGHERISVSAGARGLQLWIAPDDLIRACAATVAALAAQASRR
jgi:Cys-tRNA(Pro)/Cys-tRNA(Cys) deacylase